MGSGSARQAPAELPAESPARHGPAADTRGASPDPLARRGPGRDQAPARRRPGDRFAYSGQIAIRVYSNGTEHGAADGRGLAEGRDPGRRPRTSPLVGGDPSRSMRRILGIEWHRSRNNANRSYNSRGDPSGSANRNELHDVLGSGCRRLLFIPPRSARPSPSPTPTPSRIAPGLAACKNIPDGSGFGAGGRRPRGRTRPHRSLDPIRQGTSPPPSRRGRGAYRKRNRTAGSAPVHPRRTRSGRRSATTGRSCGQSPPRPRRTRSSFPVTTPPPSPGGTGPIAPGQPWPS